MAVLDGKQIVTESVAVLLVQTEKVIALLHIDLERVELTGHLGQVAVPMEFIGEGDKGFVSGDGVGDTSIHLF